MQNNLNVVYLYCKQQTTKKEKNMVLHTLSSRESGYVLTDENYYQDTVFMSTSRFKSYMECEARQLAIDNGIWENSQNSKALVLGNYIHSAFETKKAHEEFIQNNELVIFGKSKKNNNDYEYRSDQDVASQREEQIQYTKGIIKNVRKKYSDVISEETFTYWKEQVTENPRQAFNQVEATVKKIKATQSNTEKKAG